MPEVTRVPVADRARLSKLVSERLPGDALTAYYALNHPGGRVQLFALLTRHGVPTGFVVVAQTGLDLFRPLIVPVAAGPAALASLLEVAVPRGRPALIHLPAEQQKWIPTELLLQEEQVVDLYRLDPRAFPTEVNVLVTEATTPAGYPRFEIRSSQAVVAAAGLNWRGPYFAEVYHEETPQARTRGLTRAVLAAVTARMLSEQIVPLTFVDHSDTAAQAEAAWAGYRRTGDRFLLGQVAIRNSPLRSPPP